MPHSEDSNTARSDRGASHVNWWIHSFVIIVIGLLLRTAVVATPDRLTGDEIDHYQGAIEVSRGQTPTVVPFRPPAYVYFGGAVLRVFGESPAFIRMAQVLLEGFTILALVYLGQQLYGRSCGFAAGWFYALSPEHIAYSHTLWTEATLPFMMVVGWIVLLRLHLRPTVVIAIATGGVWGVLALLKPYNLYFFPILAVLSFVVALKHAPQPKSPTRLSRLIWTGGAVFVQLCTVAPWCDFSARPAVLISSQGQRVLQEGTNFYAPPQFDFSYLRDVPTADRRREGRRVGIVAFVVQNPGLFTMRAVEKMTNLWAPNSFLLRHMYSGHYGDPYSIPKPIRIATSAITVFAIGLVLILAIFGMAGAKLDFFELSVLTYLACMVGMISLTVSLSRYRVPLMPLAMILAGHFLMNPSCRNAIRLSDVRTKLLGGSMILLLSLWAYRLPSMVLALW